MGAVLRRPKFARALSAERRESILELIGDPKDNMYLALAAACGATFLVSSDADLLVLDPWRGVRIVTPAGFLAMTAAVVGRPPRGRDAMSHHASLKLDHWPSSRGGSSANRLI
jgi:hypothetical protein